MLRRSWTHNLGADASGAVQDLQRILTRSLDLLYSGTTNSSGLQTDCDFLLVIKTMETQLLAWHHEWVTSGKITGGCLSALLPVSGTCLTMVLGFAECVRHQARRSTPSSTVP